MFFLGISSINHTLNSKISEECIRVKQTKFCEPSIYEKMNFGFCFHFGAFVIIPLYQLRTTMIFLQFESVEFTNYNLYYIIILLHIFWVLQGMNLLDLITGSLDLVDLMI